MRMNTFYTFMNYTEVCDVRTGLQLSIAQLYVDNHLSVESTMLDIARHFAVSAVSSACAAIARASSELNIALLLFMALTSATCLTRLIASVAVLWAASAVRSARFDRFTASNAALATELNLRGQMALPAFAAFFARYRAVVMPRLSLAIFSVCATRSFF